MQRKCQGSHILSPTTHYAVCVATHRRARAPRQSYSAAEFDALSEKYAALNWRIVSKPGGATVKPDEFYTLYGRAARLPAARTTGPLLLCSWLIETVSCGLTRHSDAHGVE